MPKYTFDTKFAVLEQDEEVMALINEFCPELVGHPLKNMAVAMGMTPNSAMPFFTRMYSAERIEEFRKRLEAIE